MKPGVRAFGWLGLLCFIGFSGTVWSQGSADDVNVVKFVGVPLSLEVIYGEADHLVEPATPEFAVGVIDTLVDSNHPALASRVFRHPARDQAAARDTIRQKLDYLKGQRERLRKIDKELTADLNRLANQGFGANQQFRGVFSKRKELRENLEWIDRSEAELSAALDGDGIYEIVGFGHGYADLLSSFLSQSNKRFQQNQTEYVHGTHVAGIAMDGLENVQLFPIFISMEMFGDEGLLREAFQMAVDHNVRVINASLSLIEQERTSLVIQKMAREFPEIDIFLSAGNADRGVTPVNLDTKAFNREVYQIPNLWVVGSTDVHGNRSRFSFSGPKTVAIAAWGENRVSSVPQGEEAGHKGTSMAAPSVANAFAKILLRGFSNAEAREILLETAYQDRRLTGFVRGGRVLDAQRAIQVAESRSKENSDSPLPESAESVAFIQSFVHELGGSSVGDCP